MEFSIHVDHCQTRRIPRELKEIWEDKAEEKTAINRPDGKILSHTVTMPHGILEWIDEWRIPHSSMTYG